MVYYVDDDLELIYRKDSDGKIYAYHFQRKEFELYYPYPWGVDSMKWHIIPEEDAQEYIDQYTKDHGMT